MSRFFDELKKRNVFRVAVAYIVIGWLLMQVADTLVPVLQLSEETSRYIFLALLIGFIPTLLFSWAYELTPEGLKREKDVERDKSITHHTAKKLDLITLFAVFLLLVMIVWQQMSPVTDQVTQPNKLVKQTTDTTTEDTSPLADASIAVLPFADLSAEGNQGYFSDGIAEEILNVLVKIKELNVSSRTSSFQFKGRDIGIPEIAKQLKVKHVLEGSVRKAGDTIRVTAQLIEAQTDKHLWSETYDRPLTAKNIFAIQDDISKAIVAALKDHLGISITEKVAVKASTDNLTAYDLYLKARPLFQSRFRLDEADQWLIQALEQDPNFVPALETRAALQSLMVEYGYSQSEKNDVMLATEKLVNRALSIEPNSALAIAVSAKSRMNSYQQYNIPVDMNQLEKDYNFALELDPRNASALNWRGLHYNYLGFLDKSLQDFQTCVKYEPLYVPCRENVTDTLSELGRYEESMDSFIAGLNNSSQKIQYVPLYMLAKLKKEVAFKTATNNFNLLFGWHRHDELYEAYQNLDQDHSELARDIKRFAKNHQGIDALMIDSIIIALGSSDLIENPFFYWGEGAKKYRQSQHFKSYIKKSGILAYWQDKGFPPQCKPVGQDDFECD
ncbi:hypothetical protein [Kangiella sp. TOML190]|uniref:tetratricopeptide repeat protein n=1 Tax=Kangiella sp. TOML190 TaxID=2931351 RepID=UPI00203ECD2C|nr:hypothetical protein [Kangiella sp. TOML190]